MKKFGLLLVVTFSAFVLANIAQAVDDKFSQKKIEQRLQPVGKARVGEATQLTATATTAKVVAGGEKIYQEKCSVCHASGLAGAPKTGDAAAWKTRQDKGMKTLLKNAINGINAMPPKGTCVSCSDDELKSAIEFMLPKKS